MSLCLYLSVAAAQPALYIYVACCCNCSDFHSTFFDSGATISSKRAFFYTLATIDVEFHLFVCWRHD